MDSPPPNSRPTAAFISSRSVWPISSTRRWRRRSGYYALAPQPTADLADTVLSSEPSSDIPIVLQTGYSKPNHAPVVKVQIVARIGVAPLRFNKVAGRSDDTLDIVVALFESNGTYVTDSAESDT